MNDGDRPATPPPTMRDIAQRVGVAASTVSRALRQPERVSARTREQIARVAEELGYQGNEHRQRTRNRPGSSGVVAVTVPSLGNPFFVEVVRGAQDQLAGSGFHQLLIETSEAEAEEAQTIARIAPLIDGAVIHGSRMKPDDVLACNALVPMVSINRPVDGVSSVVADTSDAEHQVLEHLLSLGHTKIAYVAGPERSWTDAQRWKTIEKYAVERGMEPVRLGPFEPIRPSGATAADAALRAGVTAAIAVNDLVAIGMLQRLRSRGVRVPEEMSIVGCDDIHGADFCEPALTTITSPAAEVGRRAVAALLGRLGSSDPEATVTRIEVRSHLTVRDSTGRAPESVPD